MFLPFKKELNKYWWHRLFKVLLIFVVLGTSIFILTLTIPAYKPIHWIVLNTDPEYQNIKGPEIKEGLLCISGRVGRSETRFEEGSLGWYIAQKCEFSNNYVPREAIYKKFTEGSWLMTIIKSLFWAVAISLIPLFALIVIYRIILYIIFGEKINKL